MALIITNFFLIREINVGILLICCRKADTNKYAWKIVFWHFVDKDISRFKNIVDQVFFPLKSLDPIHRRILWTRRKQSIRLVCVFNHTHVKLIKKCKTKNMSTVNRKNRVTPCFVSHGFGLRIFIVEQRDSVNNYKHQNCFS